MFFGEEVRSARNCRSHVFCVEVLKNGREGRGSTLFVVVVLFVRRNILFLCEENDQKRRMCTASTSNVAGYHEKIEIAVE